MLVARGIRCGQMLTGRRRGFAAEERAGVGEVESGEVQGLVGGADAGLGELAVDALHGFLGEKFHGAHADARREHHGEKPEVPHGENEQALVVAFLVEAADGVLLNDLRDGLGGGKAVCGQRAQRGNIDVAGVALLRNDEAAGIR